MAFELTEQVQRHLSNEAIGWLTTVTASGRPAPRPVWFTWDGTTITIYSRPNAAKLRHIAANDQVSYCTSTRARAAATSSCSTVRHDGCRTPSCPRKSRLSGKIRHHYRAG